MMPDLRNGLLIETEVNTAPEGMDEDDEAGEGYEEDDDE